MNHTSLHIGAEREKIADTVLMPGDPMRSRFIAEHYLEHAELVSNVRGIQGYTGTYRGKRVTVMASGMGMPSMGIYSYELYHFYGVDAIIRIGSAGALADGLRLRDLVIGMGACTDGNYAEQFRLRGAFAPIADYGLVRRAQELCAEKKIPHRGGNLLSSDLFYDDGDNLAKWRDLGVLAVEMEAAALYINAARAGKKALALCTVSDEIFTGKKCTAEERERSFTDMMEVALEMA